MPQMEKAKRISSIPTVPLVREAVWRKSVSKTRRIIPGANTKPKRLMRSCSLRVFLEKRKRRHQSAKQKREMKRKGRTNIKRVSLFYRKIRFLEKRKIKRGNKAIF